ncbi:hypothetical protein EB796_016880 [Bugula neritina]|uniref:Apple domain-containing protein n=1 Tax=Bugula neritina TaxID=10212 RepID=A0A7J7JGU0_BUGNE|nr:hypothetical protein EB796_016880 [Bugula neritina]
MELTNTPMYTLYGWHKHCFTWQADGKLDSVPGKVALFNMWDYILTETEIQELGCNDRGNVINWDTLKFMGQADIIYEKLTCNDKEAIAFPKSYRRNSQQMMFCKVKGSRINADTVSTHTVKSAAQCIRICTSSSLCQSVNYDIQTGSCELYDVTDLDDVSLTDGYGEHAVHYTSRDCTV